MTTKDFFQDVIACPRCLQLSIENLCSKTGFRYEDWKPYPYCPICSPKLVGIKDSTDVWFRIDKTDVVRPQLRAFLGQPPRPENEAKHVGGSCYVFAAKGDPAVRENLPEANWQLTSTGSDESLQFIKANLSVCEEYHLHCRQTRGKLNNRRLSIRLLDLHSETVRLRDKSALDETLPEYLTLSHRWPQAEQAEGPKMKQFKTTLENVKERSYEVPLNELLNTFRQAIEIARKLGIFYLWIDALCIVQDDEEELHSTIPIMGHIYANSCLTIAAAVSSLNPNEGSVCFNSRSTPVYNLAGSFCRGVELSNTLSTGEESRLLVYETLDLPDMTHHVIPKATTPLTGCPLSTRGWVFQEKMLSPRTIHFTSTQLVWECKELLANEDGLPTMPPRGSDLSSRRPSAFSGGLLSGDKYEWYTDIATEYSRRQFTNCGDRMRALSGVAWAYARLHRHQYLAGMWKHTLAEGLGWIRKPFPTNRYHDGGSTNLDPPPKLPTWCWMSHPFEVEWQLLGTRSYHATLSQVQVEMSYVAVMSDSIAAQQDMEPFREIRRGSLTVRGLGKAIECDQRNWGMEIIFYPDQKNEPPQLSGTDVLRHVLVLYTSERNTVAMCLVVVALPDGSGFTRVGCIRCHGSETELESWYKSCTVQEYNLV